MSGRSASPGSNRRQSERLPPEARTSTTKTWLGPDLPAPGDTSVHCLDSDRRPNRGFSARATARRALLQALLSCCWILLLTACSTPVFDVVVASSAPATDGAVVCVEPLAASAGARVLADGGNAIDAAVATALALAVTWPEAGNLGGGGFMLVRLADGTSSFVDYREKAPNAAGPDLFLDEQGEVDPHHVRLGFRPVGVPGTVAGLALVHDRFGRLPWARLVQPAIQLAEAGFKVSPALATSIASAARELALCDRARAVFLHPDGSPLEEGERLRQVDLAWSLKRIAAMGRDAFYTGMIARRIVADSEKRGGILQLEDFQAYEAVVREPLSGTYRGYEVIAGPPPTGGGAILLESLNQLEQFELGRLEPGSARELHLLGEVLRRAFLDRALHLGDSDFVAVPLDRLVSKEHALGLAAGIDPHRASTSDSIAGDLAGTLLPAESDSTTHFSVIDRDGNAVSNTYTLEESWGAKVVASGTGIVLNNEMHDFNVQPGVSSRAGRVGTAPNLIAPGKRMLSSMCPVILTRDRQLFLVAGSPGGRTIPSTVLRVVTAVIDHRLHPADAVRLARVHHGLYPDLLSIEERASIATVRSLESMGHSIRRRRRQGDCHVIGRHPDTGRFIAVADDRLAGAAGIVLQRD